MGGPRRRDGARRRASRRSRSGCRCSCPTLRDGVRPLARRGRRAARARLGRLARRRCSPGGSRRTGFGERVVLALGLAGCAACLVGAAYAPGLRARCSSLLALAGAAGASVNSASGRAVMHWFGAERARARARRPADGDPARRARRGARAARPRRVRAGPRRRSSSSRRSARSVRWSARSCCEAASTSRTGSKRPPSPRRFATRRLWRLSVGSGLYLYAQVAVIGFGVLFLHDEHGLSDERRGARDRGGAGARGRRCGSARAAGRMSSGRAVGPLRQVGIAIAVGLARVGARSPAGRSGCSFPRSQSPAGCRWRGTGSRSPPPPSSPAPARSGAAIGFQQTVLAGLGVAAPVAVRCVGVRHVVARSPFAARRARSRSSGAARRCGPLRARLGIGLPVRLYSRVRIHERLDSSTRSAAGRARTGRTRRPRRTRRTSSRRRGCEEAGLEVRWTRAATCSARSVATRRRLGRLAPRLGSAGRPLRRRARRRRRDRGRRAGRRGVRRRVPRRGGRLRRQPALCGERAALPRAFLELHVEQGPVLARSRRSARRRDRHRRLRARRAGRRRTRRPRRYHADGGPLRRARCRSGGDPARARRGARDRRSGRDDRAGRGRAGRMQRDPVPGPDEPRRRAPGRRAARRA